MKTNYSAPGVWIICFAILGVLTESKTGFATDLIPFGSNWSYLHTTDGLNGDPALDDNQFVDTWFRPDYDTTFPIEWAAPAPAPFAYGNPDDLGNPNVIHVEAFMPESPFFVRDAATFLPQPAAGDRYTTYFRHTFTTDVDSTDIGIELLIDDGAKLYLDGTEMISFNCCENSGPGQAADYTELTLGVGNELFYSIGGILAGQTIPAGEHTLAVEVHQQATNSSDMGFSMRLYDGHIREEHINKGETWNYFKGNAEPSNGTLDWTAQDFDDSTWQSGTEGFGYEAGPDPNASVEPLVNTPLDDMNGNYSTFYLRKKFNVSEPEFMNLLFFEVDYDDGFVAYINNTQVAASIPDPDGDPATGIPFNTLGQDVMIDQDGNAFQHESTNGDGSGGDVFTVDLTDFPGLLNPGGDNVLAIQGINWQPSSDFVLAQLELLGFGERTLGQGIPGDFNNDQNVDAQDINDLSAAIRDGSQNPIFDVDESGGVDTEDRSFWVKDIKRTYIGDSNLDGEFNTRDFVLVFANNEYEDGIDGNSGWEEGDWDGDGDFSTTDFVAAFIGAGFEVGPRVVASVPEPTSSMLVILISFCGLCLLRRSRKRAN